MELVLPATHTRKRIKGVGDVLERFINAVKSGKFKAILVPKSVLLWRRAFVKSVHPLNHLF